MIEEWLFETCNSKEESKIIKQDPFLLTEPPRLTQISSYKSVKPVIKCVCCFGPHLNLSHMSLPHLSRLRPPDPALPESISPDPALPEPTLPESA
uniref:Uncharacterized protein n=1 Tax=Picea glauca TaxID=3330 RepID=A0A101M063_PICGL|nr:hypothetical protein ABT39_MTgene4534 [Picea glauca]